MHVLLHFLYCGGVMRDDEDDDDDVDESNGLIN